MMAAIQLPRWCAVFFFIVSMMGLSAHGQQTNKPQTIVVLGDSIAAGYGVSIEEAFPALLQKKIDAAGLPFRVVNAGVSGDTTAGGARRIGWVLRQSIDILIIELGGNDGLRGIAPEETRSNLGKIIDAAREKNPGMKILLSGMQMPQNMGADYVERFKAVFPQVAEQKKVTLIPHLLEGVGGKADLNQSDRIHPNPKGHQIIADTIWTVLKPLLAVDNNRGVRPQPVVQ